jgi:hypothetical protein
MADKSYHPKWDDSQKEFADAITKLELWNWLAQDEPPKDKGYMFWGHENIDKISKLVENQHHSGASFAFYLRNMQYWAKNYNNNLE